MAALSVPLAFLDTSKPPLLYIDWSIWLIFVFDYFYEFNLAVNKKSFFRHHIIELISILPFEAFPAIRILRLVRIFAFSSRFLIKTKEFLIETKVYIAFIITGIILIFSGIIFSLDERDSFLDGLLWALGVATTSGSPYQAHTEISKILNIILMFTGIGLVGYFTGALASWLTKEKISNEDLNKKLDSVIEELKTIEIKQKKSSN
ncbi:potassium transporter Kef [Oenococcus oeni]|uniref:ion channel n=1 Tax=Oenococcus oeni TaxID=1247 RepID=UPI0008F93A32|nr:ion channel [Oenococcus oeni]OIK57609.1 potassium transporter Kef [Oenococcus oeni]OIK88132.1 potassium transporter Kef [Oenococcus oeni]OIL10214.1 potassium transporter Kef [Oenococcus oeni]OIL15707.1 potassium transporter Kef [Oenococcus oeni]OIM26065.1 potassium transporter Kef [Oenococcus oeni]